MKYLRQLSFTNLIIYISFFFTIILTITWLIQINNTSEKIINNYQDLKFQEKKELVKNEVLNAKKYIDYMKTNTENDLKRILKNKIYDAYNITNNLYNKFKDKKSSDEIKQIIKEALRDIRFFDGRGYYYALDLDGKTILHPIFPNFEETKKLKDFIDIRGLNLHNKFVDISKSKDGEGFVEYYFYRTDSKNIEDKKVGFIKYFEPFNMYIGAAEYLKDYEKILQKDVLNRLNELRYGKNGYLFATTYNGIVIMNPMSPQIVGEDFSNFRDPDGNYVVKDMIKASKKSDGDFIYYKWQKPDTNNQSDKFSYVISIDDWEWIIAGGSYYDDIQTEIFYNSLKKKEEHRYRIAIIAITSIVLLLLSLFLMILWNRKTKKSINDFINFFEKASDKNLRINSDDVIFLEFRVMANYINEMLDSKELLQKKLENLAIKDRLTNLYNRHKLDEIVQNELERSNRFNHNFSFSILDIDNFKHINDTYGHQIGDEVLIKIAKILKESIRKVDYVGRWGGEEFLILCPETDINGSKKLLEKIRKNIEESKIIEDLKVTASFGLTELKKDDTLKEILKRADDALYEAKKEGKNRVVTK